MINTAVAALIVTVLVFTSGAGVGWVYGKRSGDKALQSAYDAQRRAYERELTNARTEGAVAVDALREEVRHINGHSAKLQERLRHVPLTTRIPREACADPGVASGAPLATPARPAAESGVAPGAPPAGDAAAAQPAEHEREHEREGAGAGGGIRLTLGAVWLWNSALAGVDVPAATCGADGTAGPACAAASGAGLVDAWRNQAQNAAICRANAARHTRLIQYLQATRPADAAKP